MAIFILIVTLKLTVNKRLYKEGYKIKLVIILYSYLVKYLTIYSNVTLKKYILKWLKHYWWKKSMYPYGKYGMFTSFHDI